MFIYIYPTGDVAQPCKDKAFDSIPGIAQNSTFPMSYEWHWNIDTMINLEIRLQ